MNALLFRISLFWVLIGTFTPYALSQERDEYKKWLQQEQEKLRQFKDERDKEFTEFLKREWRELEAFQGFGKGKRPKPIQIPVYHPDSSKVHATISPPAKVQEISTHKEMHFDHAPSEESVRLRVGESLVHLSFFDQSLELSCQKWPPIELKVPLDKESISDAWSVFSRSSYEGILSQAQSQRARLRLNDWGYVLLVYQIGLGLFPESTNEATLFTWFILSKSGYEAKIGFNHQQIFLLLPARENLYHVPYFVFPDQESKFYAPALGTADRPVSGSIFTYAGKYPGADGMVDFRIQQPPILRSEVGSRQLRFSYEEKNYAISVSYSKSAVDFFRFYPQTDFDVYFDARPSAEAEGSLLGQLQVIVRGKSEWQAVNILLRFVQTSFAYKTDEEQFGREKSFFPDETLHYPFSDCEDRAILFSYLVRHLLGLEVIGLDYPEHIATAVRFSSELPGEHVRFENKIYVICDPTYVNADVGVGMPLFKDVVPKPIRIE
jgi:hypothetical protein